MFWRDQEDWYGSVLGEWAKATSVVATMAVLEVMEGALALISRTSSLRLQEEDHIAHVAEKAPCVDVLNKLQKNSVYCNKKWVHHCTCLIFTRFRREETPAAQRPFGIDKTLVTIEKRTGHWKTASVFFWGLFALGAKGC